MVKLSKSEFLPASLPGCLAFIIPCTEKFVETKKLDENLLFWKISADQSQNATALISKQALGEHALSLSLLILSLLPLSLNSYYLFSFSLPLYLSHSLLYLSLSLIPYSLSLSLIPYLISLSFIPKSLSFSLLTPSHYFLISLFKICLILFEFLFSKKWTLLINKYYTEIKK